VTQLVDQATQPGPTAPNGLVGEAPPSPAGPIEPGEASGLPEPPAIMQSWLL